MSGQDPDQERRQLLRTLRRTGIFAGVAGAGLTALAATRPFTNALIDAQFAVVVGILGGISLLAWASMLQTARDLEHMTAAIRVRAEPTKQEVRGWVLKWAGVELLMCFGIGALGVVMFGVAGAIVGSAVAAVMFSSIWIRAIRRIRAHRRSQTTA